MRRARTQKVLLLDAGGFHAFTAFRAWCRQDCAPAVRPFLESWPTLCLRLALIQAIMAKHDSIAPEYVERAAEFLKSRSDFEIDQDIDNKLLISVSPEGYLKRIKKSL